MFPTDGPAAGEETKATADEEGQAGGQAGQSEAEEAEAGWRGGG